MAERKRMTAEEVVGHLLEGEGLDFLRESLSWVVQQLMEAEVSELIGAERGERAPEERLTHRNGYRSRAWSTRAGGSDFWRQRRTASQKTGSATLTFDLGDGTVTVSVVVTVVVGTGGGLATNGTAGTDMIFALGGNDTLNGGAGSDLLCGATATTS